MITGINLIKGTSAQTQSLQLTNQYNTGHITTSGEYVPVEPNTDYTYHANILQAPADAFVVVNLLDKDKKKIKLISGTSYGKSKDGLSQVTFNTGADVHYVQLYPVAFHNQETGTVMWQKEMFEPGNLAHAYMPELSEMSDEEAIMRISQLSSSHLPIINVTGDSTQLLANNTKSVLPFTFVDKDRRIEGYVKMEWQGNSSTMWPKKGFKFKTYTDPETDTKLKWQPEPDMYKSNNFQLKAYYTDKWHMRDVCAAEIISWFIANNDTLPWHLMEAPHFGTITGTPVLLYFNGSFYGLMTLKTHTSSELFFMDKKEPTFIALENDGVTSEGTANAGNFKDANATIGKGFSLESDNDELAQPALSKLLDFVVNSSDADFVANFDQHFNVKSVADYILAEYFLNDTDAFKFKNCVLLTYNTKIWELMPYDFDSSLDGSWDPGKHTSFNKDDYFTPSQMQNNLLWRFSTLMPDKLLERFNELDSLGVFNFANLKKVIDDYTQKIGQRAYNLEWSRWSDNPEYQDEQSNSLDDIKYMLAYRRGLLKKRLIKLQK